MKPFLLTLIVTAAACLIFPASVSAQSVTIAPAVFTGSGLNDATSGGRFTSVPANAQYVVTISATGTPDQFTWAKNGGTASAPVAVTGSAQALADGVTITFAATTGHTVGDAWAIAATANGSSAAQTFVQRGIGATFRDMQSKARDSVAVQDFGAKCDGSTNDAADIQRAIDSLGASGGTVVFPAAKCSFGSTLKKPRNVTLQGKNGRAATLAYTGAGVAVLIADDEAAMCPSPATVCVLKGGFDGIRLLGPATYNSGLNKINASTSTGVYMGGDPASVISPATYFGDDQTFFNSEVASFGVGIQCVQNCWALHMVDSMIDSNVRGYYGPYAINQAEKMMFINVIWNANNTPFQASNSNGDYYFYGNAFDYNWIGSADVVADPGNLLNATFTDCHFEKLHGSYMSAPTGALTNITIRGGLFFLNTQLVTPVTLPSMFSLVGFGSFAIYDASFFSTDPVTTMIDVPTGFHTITYQNLSVNNANGNLPVILNTHAQGSVFVNTVMPGIFQANTTGFQDGSQNGGASSFYGQSNALGAGHTFGSFTRLQSQNTGGALLNGDWFRVDYGGGHDGTGWTGGFDGGTAIVSQAEQNWSAGNHGAGLHFFTTPNGAPNYSEKWTITNAGHFLAATDAVFNIGASGASRPYNIFAAGRLQLGVTNYVFLSTLACNTAMGGTHYPIADSNTNVIGTVITGSGPYPLEAYCNGSFWVAGAGGVLGAGVARTGVATSTAAPAITCTSSAVPSGGGTPVITCTQAAHTHIQN